MKIQFTLLLFLTSFFVVGQTPCENNTADGFGCSGYDLLSQITISTMNSVKANDSWGWTDPMDGKEYAIICLNEATAFIDVSDPLSPVYLGQLPGESLEHTTWRDAKTYANYAYIVSEDSGHGMQVFDLTKLRDVTNPPVIFSTDNLYTNFGKAHNIAINEETGFAYAVGTNTFGEGLHFIDLSDPANPVPAGGYASAGYTHDAHIVSYDGPDPDYEGREICMASNETEIAIIDVTNKNAPVTISTVIYSNVAYTHQGWLTEDHRYFILGDERDEIDDGIDSRTLVFDFEDLDNPSFHFAYSGPTGATDHNGYVKGDKFYLANNAAGLRVIDISDIANGNMEQSGYFDSYPADNNAGFNGSWNVYPYFESGNIVISDRAEGMLLVRPSNLAVDDFSSNSEIILYPNPADNTIVLKSDSESITRTTIIDIFGKIVFSEENFSTTLKEIGIAQLSAGMYFVEVNNRQQLKFVKK